MFLAVFTILVAVFATYSSLPLEPFPGLHDFHYVTEVHRLLRPNGRVIGSDRRPYSSYSSPYYYENGGVDYETPRRRFSSPSENLRRSGLRIFADLLDDSGLTNILTGPDSITIFVPTDEAFTQLSRSQRQRISTDSVFRRQLLQYHMTRGRNFIPQSTSGSRIVTSMFKDLPLTLDTQANNQHSVNGVRILASNLESAENLVVHVIEDVLSVPFEDGISGEANRRRTLPSGRNYQGSSYRTTTVPNS